MKPGRAAAHLPGLESSSTVKTLGRGVAADSKPFSFSKSRGCVFARRVYHMSGILMLQPRGASALSPRLPAVDVTIHLTTPQPTKGVRGIMFRVLRLQCYLPPSRQASTQYESDSSGRSSSIIQGTCGYMYVAAVSSRPCVSINGGSPQSATHISTTRPYR